MPSITPVAMAVSQSAKAKPASKSLSDNASAKSKSQMHRRSRTGESHLYNLLPNSTLNHKTKALGLTTTLFSTQI